MLQVEIKRAVAQVNGVFGELLQGVTKEGKHFLVTCPVNIYSKATFNFDDSLQEIKVTNTSKYKAQALSNKVFSKHNLKIGGFIDIETYFPEGKGLGSSSADLVATARALSSAYSLDLSTSDIEDLIRGIEPTDGIMYSEIVSFFHQEVKLHRRLGKIEGAMIVGVDEGGMVDTVTYNQRKKEYSSQEKVEYEVLMQSIAKAIEQNDIFSLGNTSTRSAILNQRHNYKKFLGEFITIKQTLNLPGIIIAHSGTYIGFLLSVVEDNYLQKLSQLKNILISLGCHPEEYFII